jgi:hypothetical protein
MTLTEKRQLARRARRYGHFDTGRTLWVRCPVCDERVEVDKFPGSVTRQLDAAMVYHLDDCGPCER